MGDEQAEQRDQPDDREPAPERQAELRAAYEANMAAGKAPYEGVALRTRGELRWVMREREWTGDLDERFVMYSAETPVARPDLRGVILKGADLRGMLLRRVDLRGADLVYANLAGVTLVDALVGEARLGRANLSGANLRNVNFTGALLTSVNLSGALLAYANLSGARLLRADLRGADLHGARMDATTVLGEVMLDEATRLVDVVWNGAPLTQIRWDRAQALGDAHAARQALAPDGKSKDAEQRLMDYERAVRANRQLAVALRAQGLNEDADRFAYAAQVLQREVLRRQGQWGRALGSWLLDMVAGFGYKPMRSVSTYVLVVAGFAVAYFGVTNFGVVPTHSTGLAWYEALVLSISSFHGRGLFPSSLTLGDPIAILAAIEAVIGLLIEITFIATFTQRFFAR